MSFKYPEIKVEGSGEQTQRTENGWDATCSSFELLSDNIQYNKRKKPQQSPININTKTVQECSTLCNLEINYSKGECRMDKYEDNLIRILPNEGNYIKYGENNYELKFIFFHTPSNHLIDGKSSHMEINFYHGYMEDLDVERVEEARKIKIKNKHNHEHYHAHTDGLEDKNLGGRKNGVVLSVFVNVDEEDTNETRGTKPNIFFSQFIHTDILRDLKPNDESVKIEVGKKWSIEHLLPEKKSFYSYSGSIAMPPCTEKYQWIIFDQHITIISEYLKLMRTLGNPKGNRQTHPLNNRMVFFNPNVKITPKPLDKKNKNTFVEDKLSPIRIMYDNRAGSEYRARAEYVINNYSGGPNTGYMSDAGKLKNIVNEWEETSKIGYSDTMIDDIDWIQQSTIFSNITSDENKEFLDSLVLDYYIYNELNYTEYFIKEILNDTNNSKINTVIEAVTNSLYVQRIFNYLNVEGSIFKNIDALDSAVFQTSINQIHTNLQGDLAKNYIKEKFNGLRLNEQTGAEETLRAETDLLVPSDFEAFKAIFTNAIPNTINDFELKRALLYILITWDKKNFPDITNLMDVVNNVNDSNVVIMRRTILFELIKIFKGDEDTRYLIFKKKNGELTETIDGNTCQEWGSHQVHYEGNLLEFWKKPVKIDAEGYTFNNMDSNLKEAAKDGLMEYDPDSQKFKRHNKCRNPDNAEGAPWCYTTNPKVRWQYCALPDNSSKNRKYVLVGVFLMIIILAIFMVKLIFRNEYFSKIIASVSGGDIASKAVASAATGSVAASTAGAAATSAARMM